MNQLELTLGGYYRFESPLVVSNVIPNYPDSANKMH